MYSDPTYEAWKHKCSRSGLAFSSRFRSYLRGMETGTGKANRQAEDKDSDPTYEAWKRNYNHKI